MGKTVSQIGEIREWLGTGTLNFFGSPFAGKDFHGNRFADYLGVTLLGGGQILRHSVIPPLVKESMNRGELIYSDEYARIVVPYLSRQAFRGMPLVLSAVGRVKGEEEGVMKATAQAGHPTRAVPFLEIPEAEAWRRWSEEPDRGRADDSRESFGTRLETYQDKTLPVVAAYEEMGLLVRVDGMTPDGGISDKEVTHQALVRALHEYASS